MDGLLTKQMAKDSYSHMKTWNPNSVPASASSLMLWSSVSKLLFAATTARCLLVPNPNALSASRGGQTLCSEVFLKILLSLPFLFSPPNTLEDSRLRCPNLTIGSDDVLCDREAWSKDVQGLKDPPSLVPCIASKSVTKFKPLTFLLNQGRCFLLILQTCSERQYESD